MSRNPDGTGRRSAATRRRFAALTATAATAALAGCYETDDAPSDDESDGDESGETDSADTDLEPLDPPPGTHADGIEDPFTLVEITRDVLVADDYDVELAVPVGVSGTGTVRMRSDRENERWRSERVVPSESEDVYVTGGTKYLRTTADGETTVRTQSADTFADVHESELSYLLEEPDEGLNGLLRTGTYVPAETVARNGRRLLRFDLETVELGEDTTVADADGAVFVSGDGVVYEARLTADIEWEGETGTIEWSFAVRSRGDVTVPEPDWVDRAADRD